MDSAATAEMPTANEPAQEVQPLKAISLWQPWATLIAIGAKKIETRSWETKYRGPIAIHATAKLEPDGTAALESNAIQTALAAGGIDPAALPLGEIVAVADLVESFQFTDGYDPGDPEHHFGDFTPGRWGWRLENVRALPTPIECSGGQRLWNVPEDVAAKVSNAIAAVPLVENPHRLKWIASESEVGSWYAENTAGIVIEDEVRPTAAFYIDQATEAEGGHFEVDADPQLIPCPVSPFNLLEDAQAYCQQRNDELAGVKAVDPQPEPAPASDAKPDADPVPDPRTWQLVLDARQEESKWEWEVHNLQEQLKDAKKRHEAASERLGRLIDEARFPTLFSQPKSDAPAAPVAESSEPAPDPDAWKSVPLADMGIAPKHLELLEPFGIVTHGDLASRQEKVGEWWWKDIKGLGDKGKAAIEEAQAKWWEKHPAQKEEEDARYKDARIVSNLLCLVDIEVTEDQAREWSDDQRKAAVEWATAVHYSASDNDDVIVPPKPDFLPPTETDKRIDAANAKNPATSPPVPLSDLRLTEDQIRAALHTRLIADAKGDKVPAVTAIKLPKPPPFASDDQLWVAVPGEYGTDESYRLYPLYGNPEHSDVTEGTGAYAGIRVNVDGTRWHLGGDQVCIRVRVTPPLPDPKAQAEADLAAIEKDKSARKARKGNPESKKSKVTA